MKKRFSEEQIVKMIQEQKERKSVAELSLEKMVMSDVIKNFSSPD